MNKFSITGSPYQMINMLTGAVIILILLYSYLAGSQSSNYALECIHVSVTGEECRSCGLTRSFAAMAHGDFSAAAALNRSGPLVFLFFTSQLLMRVFFGIMVYRAEKVPGRKAGHGSFTAVKEEDQEITGTGGKKAAVNVKKLATADGLLSLILFLTCFRYLLPFWH